MCSILLHRCGAICGHGGCQLRVTVAHVGSDRPIDQPTDLVQSSARCAGPTIAPPSMIESFSIRPSVGALAVDLRIVVDRPCKWPFDARAALPSCARRCPTPLLRFHHEATLIPRQTPSVSRGHNGETMKRIIPRTCRHGHHRIGSQSAAATHEPAQIRSTSAVQCSAVSSSHPGPTLQMESRQHEQSCVHMQVAQAWQRSQQQQQLMSCVSF